MTELDVSALLSVRQAMDAIDSAPVTPRAERRRLLDAQGLRLAQDIVADRDYPPFAKSLMDGYAVRSADVTSALNVELRVVGEIAAGRWPGRAIGPGETMAVMTGAPLPEGADGVIPVEDTEDAAAVRAGTASRPASAGVGPPRFASSGVVRIRQAVSPGRQVSARGSDCPAGRVVLRSGTRLEAAQLAIAASVGAAEVDVYVRPRVAVLGTGDELVPISHEPGPAQIRNSNNIMLVALLCRLGCEVTDLGAAPDDPNMIRHGLLAGFEHDALFITGGMSVGAHDHVPRLLADLGVQMKVTKLRIKPGKPFVFGVLPPPPDPFIDADPPTGSEPAILPSVGAGRSRFIFGLPGNPVSAYICTLRLASRLLARLAGGAIEERWLTGRIDAGLPPNGPREFYQPAVRTMPPGSKSAHTDFATITPLAWKGSADIFTLATANALIVRAENDPPLPKGTVLRVLEI